MTVTVSSLRRHVQTLAADRGEHNVFHPRALEESAHYIKVEWSGQGYDVVPQPYEAEGDRCENIEVTRWGRSRKSPIILVGAHYDSVAGSSGADDNASGVAALLEIGRYLAEIKTDLTVRLVAFAFESELPTTYC